ncbi:MAG: group 1 truncated hemoglobin [Galbitalea sp.]
MAGEAIPDAGSVGRAVWGFQRRMSEDPLLAWTFNGVNHERLHEHALAFVIAALGGPDLYRGRDLRTAHGRFSLHDEHFDAAVEHLLAALREAGIADSVVAELAGRLEPLRQQIVS